MKRIFWGIVPINAAATLAVFMSSVGQSAPVQADKAGSAIELPRKAEAIYARTCGYCHGHNVGPVIRGRGLPADAIVYMVRHGQGAMPAFRPTEISDAELKALSAWISTSKVDKKEHGQ